jgi:hypothetical protein
MMNVVGTLQDSPKRYITWEAERPLRPAAD